VPTAGHTGALMALLLLGFSVLGLCLTINVLVRRRAWWPGALLVGELAPFQVGAHLVLGGAVIWDGAAGGWSGKFALAVGGLSVAGLLWAQSQACRTRSVMGGAAAEVLGAAVHLPRLRPLALFRPYPPPPRSVEVVRDLRYGADPSHLADRYRSQDRDGPAPALVQVHGGGWTGGERGRQGRPLMYRMALAGWVVFDISYRLSPHATFPEHLIDVKAAIAWIRAHAAEHGIDPSFVAITGGSAGGHLAALAALTAGEPRYQPGFEGADTSVQACVPLYGVYDLRGTGGRLPKWPYLATHVLKSSPEDDPEAWRLASPVDIASSERPPFLVAHGAHDSLVGPADSRRLVAALRAAGGPPVGYAELPGATHGFDSIFSVRGIRFADAVGVVLEHLWRRHRQGWDRDGATTGVG
jgi:acetyl esterase/lipase